nr:PREDICTED: uncharacterized protein LOC105667921 [Linepithema humile]
MTTFISNIIIKISEDDSESDWTSTDSNKSKNFFFSESSSSDCSDSSNPPRRKLHRITTFMETVKEYDDKEFKEHFRLNRSTADLIINMIENEDVLPQHNIGREKICARKAFLMTLWYLSNTETFRQCSDRFDVTKSSCHRIIRKIIDFLVKKSGQYIVWPTGQRLHKVKSEFF